MTVCPVILVDLNHPYAALLGAKAPADEPRVGLDWNDWLGCHSAGATISLSTWEIHPDDDDGGLSLVSPTEVAGVASVITVGGTVEHSYRLVNTVVTTDGQTITATLQLPVRDVYKQALAA